MSIFNESDKVWMEQQAFDAVYRDGDNNSNAMAIAQTIVEDFSNIVKTDEQVMEIVKMVIAEQAAEHDYIEIYGEAYGAMFEDEYFDYWVESIHEYIERGYRDAEDIYSRIYDVSDWSENGFNIPQVDGMFDAIKEITIQVWNEQA